MFSKKRYDKSCSDLNEKTQSGSSNLSYTSGSINYDRNSYHNYMQRPNEYPERRNTIRNSSANRLGGYNPQRQHSTRHYQGARNCISGGSSSQFNRANYLPRSTSCRPNSNKVNRTNTTINTNNYKSNQFGYDNQRRNSDSNRGNYNAQIQQRTKHYQEDRNRAPGSYPSQFKHAKSRSASCKPNASKESRNLNNKLQTKDLESLLSLSPDNIILKLLDKVSSYKSLIEDASLSNDPKRMVLLIKVLHRACDSIISRENLMQLLKVTFCDSFKKCLICLIVEAHTKVIIDDVCFSNILQICDAFIDARPYIAVRVIEGIVNALMMVISSEEKYSKLKVDCKRLKEKAEGIIKEFSSQTDTKTRNVAVSKQATKYFDPPDNFRDISVLPIAPDISVNECPFLRENVIEGKYHDDNHYLDIQFRLLREDFIRPLREGIAAHRKCTGMQRKPRNADVNVYTNVTAIKYELIAGNFIYFVKLPLPKQLNIETCRRFMYGNVVCFSDDNFRALHFGHIVERSPELLRKKLIGIKFDQFPIVLNK